MKLPFLEGLDKRISFQKKYEYDDEPGAPMITNTVSPLMATRPLLHLYAQTRTLPRSTE